MRKRSNNGSLRGASAYLRQSFNLAQRMLAQVRESPRLSLLFSPEIKKVFVARHQTCAYIRKCRYVFPPNGKRDRQFSSRKEARTNDEYERTRSAADFADDRRIRSKLRRGNHGGFEDICSARLLRRGRDYVNDGAEHASRGGSAQHAERGIARATGSTCKGLRYRGGEDRNARKSRERGCGGRIFGRS